jgi:hypothetical protein
MTGSYSLVDESTRRWNQASSPVELTNCDNFNHDEAELNTTKSSDSESEPASRGGKDFEELLAGAEHNSYREKRPVLRRRFRAIFLIALYIPLLLVPWPFTVVMIYRPLGLPKYIEYRNDWTPDDYKKNETTQTWVNILNSVRALATIPLLGAVLAQSAVVYTQRRNIAHKLSLYQTFTLANRGWTNPFYIGASLIGKTRLRGSGLLLIGALTIVLCTFLPLTAKPC